MKFFLNEKEVTENKISNLINELQFHQSIRLESKTNKYRIVVRITSFGNRTKLHLFCATPGLHTDNSVLCKPEYVKLGLVQILKEFESKLLLKRFEQKIFETPSVFEVVTNNLHQ